MVTNLLRSHLGFPIFKVEMGSLLTASPLGGGLLGGTNKIVNRELL